MNNKDYQFNLQETDADYDERDEYLASYTATLEDTQDFSEILTEINHGN